MGAATLRVPTIFTAVDKVSNVYDKMTKKGASFQKKLMGIGNVAGVAAGVMAAPMALAVNNAIKFEDKMADIAKTTGLSGKPLEDYGKSILDMSKKTRTSISELQDIGIVGGTLGVPKEQLEAFTKSADLFAIALADDFGGVDTAVTQVSKIKNLFKETRDLDYADVITKAGSAINELSNKAGSASNINDFVLRMGALPDAIKPSLPMTAALGAFLEEAGVNSEIASSGFANLMAKAGDNLPKFAKQMGIGVQAAKDLYNTDPAGFALKFAKSFKGMKGTEVNKTFDALKINSMEVMKLVGALGSDAEGSEKSLMNLGKTSADAFKSGASIADEAAKKNATKAAQLQQMQNNIEAFSIIVGTQLLPILGQILEKVTPVLSSFVQWAAESPNLASNLMLVAGGLGAVWTITRLVAIWTWASSVAMGVAAVAAGGMSLQMKGNAVAIGAYNVVSGIMTAVTWLANSAFITLAVSILAATWPILAIIAAVGAIIAIFYYWDEICAWFGKQWDAFTGMIGAAWDSIVSWFQEFSFQDFFQNIFACIVDYMLFPLKSVLKLIAMIPGGIGEAAQSGLDKLNSMTDFHVSADGAEQALDSPQVANQKATNESIQTQRNTIDMNINDKGGNVGGVQSSGPLNIPIKTTSTGGGGAW